jgi:formylglycine-generating enzyme required for sulfatase activity
MNTPIVQRPVTVLAFLIAYGFAVPSKANSPPVVANVVASQRVQVPGLVDIVYTLADADLDVCTISFMASDDDGATWDVPITSVTGAVGSTVFPGFNLHAIWDSAEDAPGASGNSFRIRVSASDGHGPGGNTVFVPGGPFQMGSTSEGDDDERPYTLSISVPTTLTSTK